MIFFPPTIILSDFVVPTYLNHLKFNYNFFLFASTFDILHLFRFSFLVLEIVRGMRKQLNMIRICDKINMSPM